MFNFIKKGVSVGERDREKMDRDKERRKKEKKQRKDLNKQNLSGTMSSEELLRLDEVCISIKFLSLDTLQALKLSIHIKYYFVCQ